jgi:hypothetical protein
MNNEQIVSSRTQSERLLFADDTVIIAFTRKDSLNILESNFRTDGQLLWFKDNGVDKIIAGRHEDGFIHICCPYNLSMDLYEVNRVNIVLIMEAWNRLNRDFRIHRNGAEFFINDNTIGWDGFVWFNTRINTQTSITVSSRTQEVVTAFLNKRSKSQYAPLNTDGHKMRYEGSTIAKHQNGKLFIRMGVDNHMEKIKVLLMIPGVDSIVWENRLGYRVNGRRWSDEWFEVGLHSRLATNTTDFDVTSIWMEKFKYNKPKFAVVDTTQKQSLDFIMFVLSENDIEFKSMVSDTYGKYEPHYFLIVKPQFFDEAKQLLINKQQEL